MALPRWHLKANGKHGYFNSVHTNPELHVFCDSSKKVYRTVAYLMDTTNQ